MIKKNIIHFFLIICSIFVLISCKSKKRALRNSNYQLEKPSNKTAAKYAEEMEVSKSDIKNGKLYEFIDDWEGTKYQFGGLSKSGIDCSGLVFLIYQDVYKKQIPRITSQQVEIIKRKFENQFKEGDLIFFDYDGKKFSHVGLYLQNGYYVHASTKRGVMIEKLQNPYTYKYFSRGGTVE